MPLTYTTSSQHLWSASRCVAGLASLAWSCCNTVNGDFSEWKVYFRLKDSPLVFTRHPIRVNSNIEQTSLFFQIFDYTLHLAVVLPFVRALPSKITKILRFLPLKLLGGLSRNRHSKDSFDAQATWCGKISQVWVTVGRATMSYCIKWCPSSLFTDSQCTYPQRAGEKGAEAKQKVVPTTLWVYGRPNELVMKGASSSHSWSKT